MDESEQRQQALDQVFDQKLRQRRYMGPLHLLLINICLALTLTAWLVATYQIEKMVEHTFDREQARLSAYIFNKLTALEGMLKGSAASMALSRKAVDRLLWQEYVSQLRLDEHFPAANGLGFVEAVPQNELEVFFAEQRRRDSNHDVQSEESLLFPVTLYAPSSSSSTNQAWGTGFNMAADRRSYAAMLSAEKSGKVTMTAPITLEDMRDGRLTSGVLLIVPVFDLSAARESGEKRKLLGFVYSPVIFHHLIPAVQGERLVDFRLSDGSENLFSTLDEEVDTDAQYFRTEVLSLYGREWRFEFQSTDALDQQFVFNLPFFIVVTGLFVQLMYMSALYLLYKERRSVLELIKLLHKEYIEATQKKIETEQRFELAMQGSAVGMWDWDIVRDRIYWSAPLFSMLGKTSTQEEITPDYVIDHMHPDEVGQTLSRLNAHLEGKAPYEFDLRLKHEDGGYIWGHVSGQAMWSEDGVPIRMCGSTSTVNELKVAMEELISTHSELKKFAHLASHDLKSPLCSINELIIGLEEDLVDELDDENKDRLKMIKDRVALSLTLLQDILEYSESRNALQKIESVDLAEMISEIVLHSDLDSHQKVILESEFPRVYTVATQLKQVLTNIITNAFLHHDRDDQLVRISCQVREGEMEISVKDNGPGIPEAYHEKVFAPFQTLKVKGYGGGTGLGLSIVKGLVEDQNGRCWIEAKDRCRGTIVIFTWPMTLIMGCGE